MTERESYLLEFPRPRNHSLAKGGRMSSDFKKKSKKTKEEDEKEQLEKLQSDNDYAESLRSEGANDQEGEDKK